MMPFQPLLTAMPTLAVAAMYCFWTFYLTYQKQRERRLRERVAFMLWTLANETE